MPMVLVMTLMVFVCDGMCRHLQGKSIPGCNSYFLCKYLKDIMLQARTYLFCAIRPEATYLNYTFSTLGFAKNASYVVTTTPNVFTK